MNSVYVFYVNRGYLLALDHNAQKQTVRHLQRVIRDETSIAADEQLLLTSNGIMMEVDKRMTAYENVGTMGKPLFLYSRGAAKTEKEEMTVSQQRDELTRDILSTIELGDQYLRLKDSATQYLRLADHTKAIAKIAETTVTITAKLVQEHHHLNGGWSALVTNINESVIKLEKKRKRFDGHVIKLNELREKTGDLMEGFEECVEQLKTLVLPPSMQAAHGGQETTLYEWIRASDPDHSLQELVEQVHEQLQLAGNTDVDFIRTELGFVFDLVEKADNKEIRGINKRISQIEHSLSSLMDQRELIVSGARQIRSDFNPKLMDVEVLNDTVDKYRTQVLQMHDMLRKMNESSILLFKSKREVLDIVRNRLTGWVVTASEKLYSINSQLVLFEEKFHGLRKRLDLIRQVKETPLMFATCITEIVRRKQLQKEFRSWHQTHAERCHTFTGEENQLRTVFAAKLEKHFLRVIFQGMFDKLPIFFVKHLPDFDQSLPEIDTEYYKELRKKVGTLETVLRVNSPQVHQRLTGRPSSLVSVPSQAQLRREESFISYEQASNLTTNLQNAFPSSAWLNHDTDVDMSPCPEPILMMQAQPEYTPSTSDRRERNPFRDGRRLNSLHDIHEEFGGGHSLKSAPICIPAGASSRSPRDDQPAERVSNSSSNDEDPLVDSKEDREQFAIDDISTRSQVMEVLRPMTEELQALKRELEETKSCLDVNRGFLEGHHEDIVEKVTSCHVNILNRMRGEHEKEMDKERSKINTLSTKVDGLDKQNAEKAATISELKEEVKAKDEEIEQLKQELSGAEARQKEATDDIFKRLTIEYELAKDREASEFRDTIEEKEGQIRNLQKDVDKKTVDMDKLKKGPAAEEYRQLIEKEIREGMEKEFKSRIDLLSKGFEQKKEDAIARMRKDVEFEHKKREAEKDIEFRLAMFERDLLRSSSSNELLDDIKRSVEGEKEKIMQDGHLSPFFLTSPRPSPRKPLTSVASMSGSLMGSLASLTSPTPDSPANDFVMTPSHISIPSSPPEEIVLPKIIAPGDLTPKMDGEKEEEKSSEEAEEAKEEEEEEEEEDSAEEKHEVERTDVKKMKKSSSTPIMEESFIPGYDSVKAKEVNEEDRLEAVIEAEDGKQSIGIQSKITARSMDFMVSLNDIREGSTVLVVWDDRHNSYILFCISNYVHFVKETSVRRLGLSNAVEPPPSNPRKNWVLARVSHVDLCVIKKPKNRYMLPIDTQVYRVDVHPIPLDTSHFYQSTMPTLRILRA